MHAVARLMEPTENVFPLLLFFKNLNTLGNLRHRFLYEQLFDSTVVPVYFLLKSVILVFILNTSQSVQTRCSSIHLMNL